ncbi:hypothetical protein [Litoreibacter meonggei]|uniref:hypothetical protein n=1 Tax=Litoreibacter meonggei TaxID=1049199 RepID=UPI001B8660D8|nr:hypothetical protein [Litoreibacter meonggei]
MNKRVLDGATTHPTLVVPEKRAWIVDEVKLTWTIAVVASIVNCIALGFVRQDRTARESRMTHQRYYPDACKAVPRVFIFERNFKSITRYMRSSCCFAIFSAVGHATPCIGVFEGVTNA